MDILTDREAEQGMGQQMKAADRHKPTVNMDLIRSVYRMRDIDRFSGMPLIRKNNLVEHCYNVGNLFVEIARAEELFITKEEILFVFRHDIFEVSTGDILRPAKERTTEILEHWKTIEQLLVQQHEFQWLEGYTDTWAEEHMSKRALKLFLDCDLLDIVFTLSSEVLKGNRYVLGETEEFSKILNVRKLIHRLWESSFETIRHMLVQISADLS